MTATRLTWRSLGLQPYPTNSPPYSHVLGRGRLVAARFDSDSVEEHRLSSHWYVETVMTVVPDLAFQRNDLVVWVGPDRAGDGEQVWSPGLVVEAERNGGSQRVTSLGFIEHEPLPIKALPAHVRRAVRGGGQVSAGVRSQLLDGWGLDVLCEICGDLGERIVYGLMPAPLTYEGEPHLVDSPWDLGGSGEIAGCSVEPGRYRCRRCGYKWPSVEPLIVY